MKPPKTCTCPKGCNAQFGRVCILSGFEVTERRSRRKKKVEPFNSGDLIAAMLRDRSGS